MPAFRTLVASTALTAAVAAPISAQETPAETPITLWDTFTFENIVTGLLQSIMPSLRALADIRYDDISVEPVRNRLSLVGADIRPFLPYTSDPEACRITADIAVISGAPATRLTGYDLNITLDGTTIDFDCLPPEAMPVAGLLGVENLRLDRLSIALTYDFASGGATAAITADLDDLLALSADIDMDYISYRMDFESEEPMLAVHLNHAALQLENRGAYTLAERMLPPSMLEPQAAGQMVAGALTQVFGEMNGPSHADLTPAQHAFTAQASAVAGEFLANPNALTIESGRHTLPLRLDQAAIDDPTALFSALAPTISTAPRAVQTALSASDLKKAIDGLLPSDKSLEVGRALVTGIGAPRNTGLGLRLLDPLAKEGNAEATALMAQTMAKTQPDTAYRLALHAASKGQPGALGLLGDIEKSLPLTTIIDVQDDMLGGGGPVASDYASIGQMRRAARAHLTGTTRIRSYQAAYYWASMAAAAGDPAGDAIRRELDTMMELRGANDTWHPITERLENGVLRDWVGRDIPALLQQ